MFPAPRSVIVYMGSARTGVDRAVTKKAMHDPVSPQIKRLVRGVIDVPLSIRQSFSSQVGPVQVSPSPGESELVTSEARGFKKQAASCQGEREA